MHHTLNKISSRVSAIFSLISGAARQQADQQKLTRHIVAINLFQSIPEIINEAALCLKDMLDYRLFAFVIEKEKHLDIWLDPRMYKQLLEPVILKDFNITDKNALHYLNHKFHKEDIDWAIDLDDLIFYELAEENFRSRIYMVPHKRTGTDGRHDEIVSMILKSCATALIRQAKIENLTDAAVIDPLTGCYNRREFINQLKRNIASATRYKNDLSIFMFDLDHFKSVNDTHGHPAGDKVLKTVAAIVKENMRSGDIFARYGGEEFIAILPETDKTKAMELADRLRSIIASRPIALEDRTIHITASFGVAQMDHRADMEKIIQDADNMLYKAKLNGRNTVMPGLIKVIPAKVQKIK